MVLRLQAISDEAALRRHSQQPVNAMVRPLAIVLLLTAAACSSSTTSSTVVSASCPRVAVLNELSELVRFRPGAGRDLTDVELEAKFSGLSYGCRYDRESVNVQVEVEIETTRGPAMAQAKDGFQYFAAITNPAGDIVAKETFSTEVEFKGNNTRLVFSDELTQRIPLLDRTTGPNWSVLLGLQLTDEQRTWLKGRRR
jgi:hypothetical protein